MSEAHSIYRFGRGVKETALVGREILGGKGAGLAEMTRLGIPVPPGFTIGTPACHTFLERGALPETLLAELTEALTWLEETTGRTFGSSENPLLVSVRSGAPVSMPGMMDTVLNVGLNDQSVRGLAERSGSPAFAWDCYRRLLQMFGTVVLDVPRESFDAALLARNLSEPSYASPEQMQQLCAAFKEVILNATGQPFPADPQEQLRRAVQAVFFSWQSERASYYRELHGIREELGTAVTVQMMVFGNTGSTSGTGVGFTRDPSCGTAKLFGEYLSDAQGEDIVAGTRTPVPLSELKSGMPRVYAELAATAGSLERHFRDVQDFEFTVEREQLYLLQTRAAKRSPQAEIAIAVHMAEEGLITRQEAIDRVKPESIAALLSPQLDSSAAKASPLLTGVAASSGSATGRIALSAAKAVAMRAAGEEVILVRPETTADDIRGIAAASGLLTARGGATSHAAVVARGMGKCCITGAAALEIDERTGRISSGGATLREGDWISLEGSTGRVFEGRLPVKPADKQHPELQKLLAWAREATLCEVRANADTAEDAALSRTEYAKGIGLCRTEHMFFASDRLLAMRSMILANTPLLRSEALDRLIPMQQQDFEQMFRAMSPLPVTIRLLDPPLHEFLPDVAEIDEAIGEARREENWEAALSLGDLRRRIQELAEANPMMGHRGCRLTISYPEILKAQVRAILRAAVVVSREGLHPTPEIMVPLVSSEEEIRLLTTQIHETAAEIFRELGVHVDYSIGTMIELPRAALCAADISRHVSFLSFGTNDLTQMTYGFSRDDAGRYLGTYLEQGILKHDPFLTVDRDGVGLLMKMAIRSARGEKPSIKIGVCGEHGGDPRSIRFFRSLGVDYVSCSPARLCVAQLAVAQSEGVGAA